jgi:hypothetical protein
LTRGDWPSDKYVLAEWFGDDGFAGLTVSSDNYNGQRRYFLGDPHWVLWVAGSGVGEQRPVNRILWNNDDEIDEIVMHDCAVHIEQMSDDCWWIGIDRADGGYWAGNFNAATNGSMTFTEFEKEGFEWDQNKTH